MKSIKHQNTPKTGCVRPKPWSYKLMLYVSIDFLMSHGNKKKKESWRPLSTLLEDALTICDFLDYIGRSELMWEFCVQLSFSLALVEVVVAQWSPFV